MPNKTHRTKYLRTEKMKSLKDIKNHKDIITLKVDKGNATVINKANDSQTGRY